ncbi:VWA domain-containing protein [Crassaminicella profunda]|uniref:VWA domain-containing protein n=1 Tax=Crassaminicella profunda TaxID=1286698 RepID=UPI001CA6BB77|nr:VWA domain-containing protein [Crassaminicella profunda]QZY55689.1 VWA domain-containing protein [Crassaminicella profunda]
MQLNGVVNIKYIILFIIVCIYYFVQAFKIYKIFPKKKFCLWISLRFIAVICLMLVLIKAQIIYTSQNTTTLFVVDQSLSVVSQKSQIEEYINQQIKEKKSKDCFGIITFGKEPMIETPITKEFKSIKIETQVENDFTNIEKALAFATDFFPGNTNKRLVLFTDGNENMGKVENILEKMKENNINSWIYSLKIKNKKDVQLTDLKIPENVHTGELVPVTVVLDANIETEGNLYFFQNENKILQKMIEVHKGNNIFTFEIPIKEEKNIDFRGEIKFKEDLNTKNNILTRTILGKDEPKVLIVGEKEDTKNLVSAFNSLNINYQNDSPKEVVDTLKFLSNFDSICLVNVSHKDLSQEFEKNLNTCVKEQGKGLLVIGGEKTFALGEYANTTLEKMLPVSCRMKGNKKQPNTGLVLVIDASGSMEDESGGVKKIEMAKEAAQRSIEVLESDDYAGVLAFSDRVEWVVPFGKVENKEKINEKIGKLASKGGTLIKPALNKSLEELVGTNTKVKHMILLTDGQGEKKGYESLLSQLKEEKITVSTVAFGKDADTNLLKSLSQSTDGRYYFAKDFYSIPEIFARETYLATKKYLNNRAFQPKLVNEAEFFQGNSVPKLKGYMGTGIKPNANLILESDQEDPIVASWQYGLGNVVAFTSDVNGKWSETWIHWSGFQKFWGNTINYCLASYDEDEMNVQISKKGANVDLYVDTGMLDSGQMINMIIQGPQNIKKEISLKQTRVGHFIGAELLEKKGDYALTFRLKKDGKIVKKTTRTVHLDYSPEYILKDTAHLENLSRVIGNNFLDESTDVFTLPIENKNRSNIPLDFILLPLALIAFIGELWVRKR